MRLETLEQILKVIAVTSRRHDFGDGIDRSYQYAVNQVSREYGVAYQTIGDACRRRLGLDSIGEFQAMLKSALNGHPEELRGVLIRGTSPFHYNRINDFFSKLKNGETKMEIMEDKTDRFIRYTIQLSKNDSDVLRALSQLLGDEPEKILAEIAVVAIKDRMKKTVNQL